MVTALSHGKRKIRKPHQCFDCYHAIPSGHFASFQTNAFDGRVYTIYQHPDCAEMSGEWQHLNGYDYADDGTPPLYDEIVESGEFENDMNAWRGMFPHVVTRMEFWQQKREATS